MTHYLISFPSGAMQFEPDEFDTVVAESHEVMEQAKAARVYVFGGGINESVESVRVDAAGSVTAGTYPHATVPNGGYTVLRLESREQAVAWAAKIAAACRCPQELREFQYDPAS